MMECVKELAVIPNPLKTPPIITVALHPKCSTNTLHKGPEGEKSENIRLNKPLTLQGSWYKVRVLNTITKVFILCTSSNWKNLW